MNLQGKNFLVIGGGGLIGSHTIDRLLTYDVGRVVVFDNFARGTHEYLEEALLDERCEIYESGGDIAQTDVLDRVLKEKQIDGVFHFAALWLLQCHEFPRSAFKTNVEGTFNVAEACVANGIERLVFSSSASVYGDAVEEPMKEDHPFNNQNFYGATKICGEAMLRALHHRYGLNYVGLRYMNVYGPRQDYNGAYIAVIMKMLDAIDRGESPVIYGDGSESFDFVSVYDCALANILAMNATVTDSFYNVGTGIKTSLLDLAKELVELTNCSMPIRFEERNQATLVKSRVGCPEKASRDLGFEAEVPITSGLKSLIDWRAAHKKGLTFAGGDPK